jgi:hypothetical protein
MLEKLFQTVTIWLWVLLIIVIGALILGGFIALMWNYTIVRVFSLPEITYLDGVFMYSLIRMFIPIKTETKK